MSPELSVVVPFYGVERYFAACLDSIRQQRLRDIEVILVDDGSLDGSRAIAEHFVDLDPRFSLVTQQNAGLGPARNTGTARASGDYLTFVDSDDLVSAGGFETMVGSLNRSGSSFAGGNARRFNNSSGVRQSWSHRNAFARTRTATHILELPVLARDRMVWNKVYRRSFWDEFHYEFPPIRYEDYPVTFKAHLDAVTVDVVSDAVYYWRERESGDSITQQAYRFDNLLDRVVSAEMVLDQADTSSPKVRREVYRALLDSDFVTIVQAFATVPEAEVPDLLMLGTRLATRLSDDIIASGHPYTLVQYRALSAGDVPLLRELAEFRGGGGLRGTVRAGRHPRRPWRLELPWPGLSSTSTPRALYAVPRTEVALRTTVSHVEWVDGSLVLRGTAEIRHHASGPDARIEVVVVGGRERFPLDVRTFDDVDSHGERHRVGFETTVDRALLARLGAAGTSVSPIEVTVRSGRLSRSGHLHGATVGNPRWGGTERVDDDLWAQTATTSRRHFVISWLRRPWCLTAVEVGPSGMAVTITGTGDLGPTPTLRLAGRAAKDEVDVVFELTPRPGSGPTELVAEIPAAAVVGSVADDDPFLHQSVRGLRLFPDLDGDETGELLLWQAPEGSVGVTWGAHLVRLTRTEGNRVALVESPLRVVADHASVDEDALVVAGTNWTGAADHELHVAWRQYLPNSDDYVEQPGDLTVDGRTWRLSTPLRPVLETTADPLDLEHRGEWVLFCSWPGREASAVVPDPFLLPTLPITHDAGARTGILAPTGDTVHFRVIDRG